MKTYLSKKRTPTKHDGVFYKEILNSDGKVVDKKYVIRWIDENGKDRLKTPLELMKLIVRLKKTK
jgi:hypothetical protein